MHIGERGERDKVKKFSHKNPIKHKKGTPSLNFLTTPSIPLKTIWPKTHEPPWISNYYASMIENDKKIMCLVQQGVSLYTVLSVLDAKACACVPLHTFFIFLLFAHLKIFNNSLHCLMGSLWDREKLIPGID
jgi:hypothetical protein